MVTAWDTKTFLHCLPHTDFLQDFKQVIRAGATEWTVQIVDERPACTNLQG